MAEVQEVDKIEHSVIKLLVLTQLVNETMDDVKGTQYYKSKVKEDIDRLEKRIKQVLEGHINYLYGADSDAMQELGSSITNVVNKLSTLDVWTIKELDIAMQNLKIQKA